MVDHFRRNASVNVVVVLCYFLLSVLPHAIVGKQVERLFSRMSRAAFDGTMVAVGLVVAVGLLLNLHQHYSRLPYPDRKIIGFYTLSTAILIVIACNVLMVINVEIIHFPQYMVLAVLLFPLIGHYWPCLFWCMLLGTVDESYQYFYLTSGRPDYFDFNDIILDTLGAASGLLLLRIVKVRESAKTGRAWQASVFVAVSVISLAIGVLVELNCLHLYPCPSAGPEAVVLMKTVPEGFWSQPDNGKVFHIVRPLEGLLICLILYGFYYRIAE